jgi:hypothetical protein
MHSSSDPYQFVHCYNILSRVQIKKFFILHFAPDPCSFPFFRSKYYCMHFVLKHRQSVFFTYCERLRSMLTENTRSRYIPIYFNLYVLTSEIRRLLVKNIPGILVPVVPEGSTEQVNVALTPLTSTGNVMSSNLSLVISEHKRGFSCLFSYPFPGICQDIASIRSLPLHLNFYLIHC